VTSQDGVRISDFVHWASVARQRPFFFTQEAGRLAKGNEKVIVVTEQVRIPQDLVLRFINVHLRPHQLVAREAGTPDHRYVRIEVMRPTPIPDASVHTFSTGEEGVSVDRFIERTSHALGKPIFWLPQARIIAKSKEKNVVVTEQVMIPTYLVVDFVNAQLRPLGLQLVEATSSDATFLLVMRAA